MNSESYHPAYDPELIGQFHHNLHLNHNQSSFSQETVPLSHIDPSNRPTYPQQVYPYNYYHMHHQAPPTNYHYNHNWNTSCNNNSEPMSNKCINDSLVDTVEKRYTDLSVNPLSNKKSHPQQKEDDIPLTENASDNDTTQSKLYFCKFYALYIRNKNIFFAY